MSSSSTLVIKVKYGDTLRRFNFCVYENEKIGMKITRLREKIMTLFSLGEGYDDFTLTYTDTDGDMVALVEDCDLEDVVLQGLNPVRMFVSLKTDEKGGYGVGVPQSIESVQVGVEELVKKNVPDMFREVVLKFTRDLAAAMSSAPVVGDVTRSASEIDKSIACQDLKTVSRKESDVRTEDSEGQISSGSINGSRNGVLRDEMMAGKVLKDKAETTDFGMYRLPDLNCSPPLPSDFLTTTSAPIACSNNTVKMNTDLSTAFRNDVNPFNECPFSGTQVDVMFRSSRMGNTIRELKPSDHQSESEAPVFHTGVQCVVCGVQPITGPRFKSKVGYNYDLCIVCFQKSGREAEYIRNDHPLMNQKVKKRFHYFEKIRGRGLKPVLPLVNQVRLDSCFISDVNVMDGTVMTPSARFTKIWKIKNTGNLAWPLGTQLVWVYGKKFSTALSVDLEIPADGLPVDSELDVAVDFVAPEIPGEYASYWRMSSPSGQQFGHRVWVVIQVGGSHDLLSENFCRFNLNWPPQNNGLKDLFVTKSNTERSLNYPYSPSKSSSPAAVSLKLSDQQSNNTVGEAAVQLFAEVLEEDQKSVSSESSETEESSEGNPILPTNDTSLPVARPYVDLNSVDSEIGTLHSHASLNVKNIVPSPQSENFSETAEKGELSEVGSNEGELDNEILKRMDSHLDEGHAFVCGVFGWDHILHELEKMGFTDKKKNAELVFKNKGSIKRVVMELVAAEKSQE